MASGYSLLLSQQRLLQDAINFENADQVYQILDGTALNRSDFYLKNLN